MITGFNTDVEYAGTTYHVQTEDKGLETPLILSLVYVGGAILASKRTSYQDLIEGGFEETALVERLQRQHKLLCAAIRAGRIEDLKRMSAGARESAHASPSAPAAPDVSPDPPPIPSTDTTPIVSTAALPTAAPVAPPVLTPVVPPVEPPVVASGAPAPVSSDRPAPAAPAEALPVAPVAPPGVSVKPPAAKETPARSPRKAAPSPERKTPPATLGEIELIPVTDPSFEAVSASDATLEKTTSVGAAASVDSSFELVSANDPSFLHPSQTLPAATPPPSPSSPETGESGSGKASASQTTEKREDRRPTTVAASDAAHGATVPPTTAPPPAPVASEKNDLLYVSLLDDEGEFRAGELVMIRIYVGFGQYGVKPAGDASVTVKILGTTFRPLILSTKTGADGTALVRALLPRFTSGRAAILIRAHAGEQDAELRRIIHHT